MLTLAAFKTTRHPYVAHVEFRRAATPCVPVWTLSARVCRSDGSTYHGATITGFFARGLSDGRTRDEMAEEGRAGALAFDYLDFLRFHSKPTPRVVVGIEGVQPKLAGATGEAQLLIHEIVESVAAPHGATLIACGRRERDRLEYARYGLSSMRWEPDAWTVPRKSKAGSVRAWLHDLRACGETEIME